MGKEFSFYFKTEECALTRGSQLRQRILEKSPHTKIEFKYSKMHLVFEVCTNDVDVLLSVPKLFLQDEVLTESIFFYVPFKALGFEEDFFTNLKRSNWLVGDLLHKESYKQIYKEGSSLSMGAREMAGRLKALGLEFELKDGAWDCPNKEEISMRYFPVSKVDSLGFDAVYAKHKCMFDYENYIDEWMKKHFIPLPESTRYPWLKYVGDYTNQCPYQAMVFDGDTIYAVIQIAKDNGYPFTYDPLTNKEYMDSEPMIGWEPDNADLLSRKFFPKMHK